MFNKLKDKMDVPIKTGNFLYVLFVGLFIIGLIFISGINFLNDSFIKLPQHNSKEIYELKMSVGVQEKSISNLETDIAEIKESNKEIQKDIKELLKMIR